MKGYFSTIFTLFIALSGAAQGHNIDSLKLSLNTEKEDTSRVMLLFYTGVQFLRSHPDSAFVFTQQGLQLARQINYPKGELLCRTNLARCFWTAGDFNSSIKLVLQDLKRVEETNDVLVRTVAFAALHDSYRDLGKYSEALKYAFKNRDIIAVFENGRFRKVMEAVIASIYLGKGDLDSTRYYLQKALSYPEVANGSDGWIYSVAGHLYTKLQKFDSAFHFYRRSAERLSFERNLKDLAGTYNSMSSLFITIGAYDSSLYYAHKSLSLAEDKEFAKEKLEASLLLSRGYEPAQKDSALHYYKLAMVTKDSVYNQEKQRQLLSYQFSEQLQEQEIRNAQTRYKAQIKIFVLLGALGIFLCIGLVLWRSNRQKQKAYVQLKSAQAQLIQSEKMASLGELTAGIAHEIQNPLNFVNNFSEVTVELVDDLKKEATEGNKAEAIAIADDIVDNLQKVVLHGKRADAIVKGMLQHSRTTSGKKEPSDINALADEYLRLSYNGFRAKDKDFNATMETQFDESIGKIEIVPQDIGRVLLNLFNNAFYAVTEKKKALTLKAESYKPTVSVSTKKETDKSIIVVRDNGIGIPQKAVNKIFQPFFTAKPTGQGTGLGLSLSYDIIKAHGGEIKVESKEGEGAEFMIILPLSK